MRSMTSDNNSNTVDLGRRDSRCVPRTGPSAMGKTARWMEIYDTRVLTATTILGVLP